MAKVTVQQWFDNWSNGLANAGAKIRAGVQRVSVAPGVSAASKANKMLAGIQAAVQSGKWAKNVSAVSLSTWQSSMSNKGVNNISAGAAQAKTTRIAQITKALADNDAAVASVQNMPTDTQDQRISKAVAFMRARSDAAKKG